MGKQMLVLLMVSIAIIFLSGCIQPPDPKSEESYDYKSLHKNSDYEPASISKEPNHSLVEYSSRTDGSRNIKVFQSKDGKTRLTIIENVDPEGYDIKALENEIKHAVPSLKEDAFTKHLEPYYIDGHKAISTSVIWVGEGGTKIGGIAEYITAIEYMERKIIRTFITNGDGQTWDDHYKLVDEFRI